MALAPLPTDALTPVAYFPENYFLENLAVRADQSILITAVLQKELWWVPPADPAAPPLPRTALPAGPPFFEPISPTRPI
jgi:hypothetical protein